MPQIEIYRTPAGFEKLASEWNHLVQNSHSNSIFMTLEWQRTWWQQLGEGELCLIAVRHENGNLIGLAPLFSGPDEKFRYTLKIVGSKDLSDYLDWIVAPGKEKEVYNAILKALLTRSEIPGWEALSLCNLPENSPTLEFLPILARNHGLVSEQSLDDNCPIIPLPTNWDAYLNQLNKKQRHELQRKLRRSTDLTCSIADSEEGLENGLAILINLMEKSQPEKAAFIQDIRHRTFFQTVSQELATQGWLKIYILNTPDRAVAAYLTFPYNRRLLIYNSGFDPNYAAQSPGITLGAHLIRQAIENGLEIVDFMRGTESYKYDLGGIDTSVKRLRLIRVLARI